MKNDNVPAVQDAVLVQADVRARIEGLMLDVTLKQTYVNARDVPLEVVYTFPLPSQAVLLGVDTTLGHERRSGAIVPRPDGERLYEQVLSDGDTPVMIELSGDGLLTANLGNLAPGERLTVELHWGQWLSEEQGRIRVALPTVVAPRFGPPALQPQQVPGHSLDAEYPLRLELKVTGALAAGEISCPSHRAAMKVLPDGVLLTLGAAALDRDVVFTLVPPARHGGLALAGRDHAAGADVHVALAAFELPPAPERPAVDLKILVDCSGSMAGDSIDSARKALAQVVRRLRSGDRVSYSRFGDTVVHDLSGLRPLDEALRHRLQRLVADTDATLGGTEMEQALCAVFGLPGASEGADVLLITDGEIWQDLATIAAAQGSRHRVFAIGVGAAPAEGVLRRIAEASGGACEFATPGESLEAAVDRSFSRIRQQPWQGLEVDWDVEPTHVPVLPACTFGGDALRVPATFGAKAPRHVRLRGRDAAGRVVELADLPVQPTRLPGTLARMLAARRLADMQDVAQATKVALEYQLLCEHTCCIAVHVRSDGRKVEGPAALHVVPQMLAAGWGGTGSVAPTEAVINLSMAAPVSFSRSRGADPSAPPMWRHGRTAASPAAHEFDDLDDDLLDIEIPAFLRKADKNEPAKPAALCDIVQRFLDALAAGASGPAVLGTMDTDDVPVEAKQVLPKLQALGLTRLDARLALAAWLMGHPAGSSLRWRGTALRWMLTDRGQEQLQRAFEVLDRELGPLVNGSATGSAPGSRAQRLLKARRV